MTGTENKKDSRSTRSTTNNTQRTDDTGTTDSEERVGQVEVTSKNRVETARRDGVEAPRAGCRLAGIPLEARAADIAVVATLENVSTGRPSWRSAES